MVRDCTILQRHRPRLPRKYRVKPQIDSRGTQLPEHRFAPHQIFSLSLTSSLRQRQFRQFAYGVAVELKSEAMGFREDQDSVLGGW
jgi:hypothetical protein